MARPAEKARAMMNKWVKMREEGNAPSSGRGKRPMLASECQHLTDADHYRNQIIGEITSGIAKIQNPGMGEHAIRDLNDAINKKLREKFHWNRRIKELGGLDFNALERKRQIEEGDLQSLQGPGGYRYFGAAKDLPGVKELFEKQVQKLQTRKRGDIFKHITPDYYGWRDEEDGVLLELEANAYKHNKRQRLEHGEGDADADGNLEGDQDTDADYLDVPSQDDFAQILLQHKKKALLAKFSF
jgi:pre-mRNA-splicing factor ISY1